VIAYAAGTAVPTGLVLVAGTGAVAAAVQERTIGRRCDGYGWLLGDEGSAVWLGREAARATLAALDGRGPSTELTAGVLAAALATMPGGNPAPSTAAERSAPPRGRAHAAGSGTADAAGREALAQSLVRWAHTRPPAELGRLAPLVDTAARIGDEVAVAIVVDAADRLLRSLDAAGRDLPGTTEIPVVLAGSVLRPGTVVSGVVASRLRGRYGREPEVAGAGAAGAAALALHRLLPPPAATAAHQTLLAATTAHAPR
jgi:N-acetylglucosamine kinase-like BadF-type ATPase